MSLRGNLEVLTEFTPKCLRKGQKWRQWEGTTLHHPPGQNTCASVSKHQLTLKLLPSGRTWPRSDHPWSINRMIRITCLRQVRVPSTVNDYGNFAARFCTPGSGFQGSRSRITTQYKRITATWEEMVIHPIIQTSRNNEQRIRGCQLAIVIRIEGALKFREASGKKIWGDLNRKSNLLR